MTDQREDIDRLAAEVLAFHRKSAEEALEADRLAAESTRESAKIVYDTIQAKRKKAAKKKE